jgi:universal stress protein A
MSLEPAILCPIDFSDASRGALRYARVIAEHFGARLLALTVEDPLLTEAVDLSTGVQWDPEDARDAVEEFVRGVLGNEPPAAGSVAYAVAVGKPADQILRVAHDAGCDLIVMSTHGLTGMRKLFFGSTTERVLRETQVPVLATSPADEGPRNLAEVRRRIGRALVPVAPRPIHRHPRRGTRAQPTCAQVASAEHRARAAGRSRRCTQRAARDGAAAASSGGARRVRRSGGGDYEDRTRSPRGSRCDRPSQLRDARPPDGIGHVSRALLESRGGPGASALISRGAPEGRRCGWRGEQE